MYKSIIKITILFFLILYTFEVSALPKKTKETTDVDDEIITVDNYTDDNLSKVNNTQNDFQEDPKKKVTQDELEENLRKNSDYMKDQGTEYKKESNNDDTKVEPEPGQIVSKSSSDAVSTASPTVDTEETNLNVGNYNETDKVENNDDTNAAQMIASDEDKDKNEETFFEKLSKGTYMIVAVGAVSAGLVAISGYRVLRKKSESRSLKSTELYSASSPPSLMRASDYQSPNLSLVNSIVSEGEREGNLLYYSARNQYNEGEMINRVPEVAVVPNEKNEIPNMQYRMSIQSEGSTSDKSVTVISVNRNSIISRASVIRHSFLNPNLNIVRTGKRTQQLFEATKDHPAIIETFPSLERPFVPAVPVPLEESDINSLHPHSIYQMYQDEMEYENYYAYTIDDKEYIIDPTTNRVLEIHDLNTDEYMLVEEELYLDFSGSSDDSDSDKQTI